MKVRITTDTFDMDLTVTDTEDRDIVAVLLDVAFRRQKRNAFMAIMYWLNKLRDGGDV